MAEYLAGVCLLALIGMSLADDGGVVLVVSGVLFPGGCVLGGCYGVVLCCAVLFVSLPWFIISLGGGVVVGSLAVQMGVFGQYHQVGVLVV